MKNPSIIVRNIAVFILALLVGGVVHAQDPEQLVFAFQRQKDPAKIQPTAERLSKRLTEELGIPVRAMIPQDYAASVQGLVSRKVDIAYVDSMPFLLARRDGNAQLLLAEQRPDVTTGELRTDYDSIFVARADSPINSIEDVVANAGSLRMVFTSQTSTSGYIMAYYRLVKEGLLQPRQDPKSVFRSVAFGGGYTQALEEVIAGRGDLAACSNYVMDGKRVAAYLKPEQREQLKVVARTPGVPTHVIIARDGLSDDLKARIKAAIIKISQDEPDLLADVYGAASFVEVDADKHVQAIIDAVEYLGLPIGDLRR
jgi:phosphonate transport system substrate-binding protein